jgi:hypothetical protein
VNKQEVLALLDKAVFLYISALRSGDVVSLDCAELAIEECHRKLGWRK